MRREMFVVGAVAVALAWLVMPNYASGPSVDTLTTKTQLPRTLAAEVPSEATSASEPPKRTPAPPAASWDAPTRAVAPDRAKTDPWAEAEDAANAGGPALDKSQDRAILRAQRVSDQFYDAALRVRHQTDMDDATYRAVVARLELADRELGTVRAEVAAGTLDAASAEAQIASIHDGLTRDIFDYGDEKQSSMLEREIGRTLEVVKGIEAWEGIPIEEWTGE